MNKTALARMDLVSLCLFPIALLLIIYLQLLAALLSGLLVYELVNRLTHKLRAPAGRATSEAVVMTMHSPILHF